MGYHDLYLSILIAGILIVAYTNIRSITFLNLFLFVYFSLTLTTELCLKHHASKGMNNHYIINLFIISQTLILFPLLNHLTNQTWIKRFIILNFVGYVISWLIWYNKFGITEVAYQIEYVQSILFCIVLLRFFYQTMYQGKLLKNQRFWIT